MDETVVDLRTNKPTKPANVLPRRFGPLPVGTILTADTPLTDEEKQTLADQGIVLAPSSELPLELVKSAAKVAQQPTKPQSVLKPIEPPVPVDIGELPAERQASIRKAISELTPKTQPDKRPIEQYPGITDVPGKEASWPASSTKVAAMAELPRFCPHCGWNQAHTDVEVSDTDKLSFMQSWIGLVRFKKVYSLLSGRATVAFRTLTSEESDACYTQAAYDVQANNILDPGQYLRTVNDYRLCLALAILDLGPKKFNLPDMDGYKTDDLPANATKLKIIVPHIYKKVLSQEPVRRAVASAFAEFQRLEEQLEWHVKDAGFWPAIVGQP